MFDGLVNGVIADIVGGRFGAQQEVVADVLLDEAVAMTGLGKSRSSSTVCSFPR